VPSALEVIASHFFVEPMDVISVHVAPESVDVQMLPLYSTAASFVPSWLEVIDRQTFPDAREVQVSPESSDV
jgi:hypothetical protein